jgi:hypothetical protein
MFGSDTKRTFSRSEVDSLVDQIQELAISLELMPEDVKLNFVPGNTSYSRPAEVTAETQHETGGRLTYRTKFLPEFHYRDSRNTVGRLLAVCLKTLEAVDANTDHS